MTSGRLHICDEGGIVRIRCEGLYGSDVIEAHALAQRRELDRRRAAGRPVRILIDLTDAIVQRPEIASLLAARMSAMYRPEDRIVALCGSKLHALQVRRANTDQRIHVTSSADEARRFLCG